MYPLCMICCRNSNGDLLDSFVSQDPVLVQSGSVGSAHMWAAKALHRRKKIHMAAREVLHGASESPDPAFGRQPQDDRPRDHFLGAAIGA